VAKRSRRSRKQRRTRHGRTLLLRAGVLATAAFVCFLYYQPLATYVRTRSTLNERSAEVKALREERGRLQARLARSSTTEALAREARRMNLVRPGERLFIVKGIDDWRRTHTAQGSGKSP
jgi:cell division protein FtsB